MSGRGEMRRWRDVGQRVDVLRPKWKTWWLQLTINYYILGSSEIKSQAFSQQSNKKLSM